MAGLSSSKKVARAARTGGGRRRNLNANLGFYSLLAAIALVGALLVWFSRDQRIDSVSGGQPPRAPTQTEPGDRWYSAYGVYVCDKFIDPFPASADEFGFNTQGDGVIYVHPFTRAYSGSNANFGVFADNVDLQIDRDSFDLPGEGQEYVTGQTKCGDRNGELVVKVWSDPSKPDDGEIREGDPNRILLKDGQAITVAFVPEGERNIPLPPSVPNLAQAPAREQAAASGGAAGGVPGVPGAQTPATPVAPGDPAAPAPAPAGPDTPVSTPAAP